jgi:hypothetical protein
MRVLIGLLSALWCGLAGFSASASTLGEGIWAYWPLIDNDFDASPLALHGQRQGQVGNKVQGGPFTGATTFEGGSIAIPADDDADFGSFTLSAWVNYDKAGHDFVPILGRLGMAGRNSGWTYELGEPGASRQLNTEIMPQWQRWAHVALVHDSAERTLVLWVNGWKTATLVLPPGRTAKAPLGGGFGIGGRAGSPSTFRGQIADLIVYRRPLGPEEIAVLNYGAGRTTPQQFGIGQGCGGSRQPACPVCRRYVNWPPANWGECEAARVPWCAGHPEANQHATCP